MNKYRRVTKEKEKKESPENEIRVTAHGRSTNYISYAAKIFNEKNFKEVKILATGTALAGAVTISEIVKRRFKGLHQITSIGTIEIVDEYEPLEEGLVPVKDVRNVSFLEVTLSLVPLDTKNPGYQPPLPDDQVKEVADDDLIRARGRRGRKGGKGGSPKGDKGGSPTSGSKGGRDRKGGSKGGKSQPKGSSAKTSKSASKGSKGGSKGKGKGDRSESKGYDSYDKGGKSKGKSFGKGSESKGKSFGKGSKGSKSFKGSKGSKGSKGGY